jgi:hypothetical protein
LGSSWLFGHTVKHGPVYLTPNGIDVDAETQALLDREGKHSLLLSARNIGNNGQHVSCSSMSVPKEKDGSGDNEGYDANNNMDNNKVDGEEGGEARCSRNDPCTDQGPQLPPCIF